MSSIIKAQALGSHQAVAGESALQGAPNGSAEYREVQLRVVSSQDLRRARRRAAQILVQARQEAAALLEAARVEADRLREKALSEGQAIGMEAGREQGLQQGMAEGMTRGWNEGMERAREAVRIAEEVLAAARRERSQALADLRADLLDLALAIAEKIVQREIERDDSYLTRLVSSGTKQLGDSDRIVARIYPGGEETKAAATVVQELAGKLQVIVDDTLEPGDCVIQTENAILDGRLSTRLSDIRQALESVGEQ